MAISTTWSRKLQQHVVFSLDHHVPILPESCVDYHRVIWSIMCMYIYIHILHLILQKDDDYIYDMASYDPWLYIGFSLHPVGEFPCHFNFDCHRDKGSSCSDFATQLQDCWYDCRLIMTLPTPSLWYSVKDNYWNEKGPKCSQDWNGHNMKNIWRYLRLHFYSPMGFGRLFSKCLFHKVSWCSSLLLLPLVTHQLSFLDEFTTWQTQIASANIRIHCVYLYPFWVFTLAAHGQGYRKRLGNPMTLSICSWAPIKADVDVLPFKLLGSLGSFGLWFSLWSHHGRFQNSWAKASNSSPALFLGSRKKFRGVFLFAYVEGILLISFLPPREL